MLPAEQSPVLQESSIKTSPCFRSCFFLRSMSARITCTWQTQMRAGCDALTGVETGRRACRVRYSRATERPGAPWLGSAAREAFSTVSACKRQGTRALSPPLHHSMRYPTRQPGWPRTGWPSTTGGGERLTRSASPGELKVMLMTTSAAGRGAAGACAWAACDNAHRGQTCTKASKAQMILRNSV